MLSSLLFVEVELCGEQHKELKFAVALLLEDQTPFSLTLR